MCVCARACGVCVCVHVVCVCVCVLGKGGGETQTCKPETKCGRSQKVFTKHLACLYHVELKVY